MAGRARVILGVAGGIAAYKACELLRRLTEAGHDVRVVPTAAALRFVGASTWAALSRHPVTTEVWDDAHEVPHVAIGQSADLVVVAPATADLLARAAHGFADDLLTNVLLTARCPIVLAPAMHTEMWEHPATVANVATLRGRGVIVLEPASGRLTGADTGPGRLPEPEEIFAVLTQVMHRRNQSKAPSTEGHQSKAPSTERHQSKAPSTEGHQSKALSPQSHQPVVDLAGRRVVVSAGGTREPLDPVRYLGNRSSGKQGYALATTAVARGAEVVLISANVALPDPAGVRLIRVGTTEELRAATLEAAATADAVVMAAAPADFRPAEYAEQKITKGEDGAAPVLRLVTNPDIAAELGERRRDSQVLVAFAAETGDKDVALANARRKLDRKRADLIVVNQVGVDKVFGQETNAITILGADGSVTELPEAPKAQIADEIWDLVAARLKPTG